MPNVYDARINRSTVGEIVYKHNRLVDLLGKDLSAVVQGGGVGDVRSPTVPGATDGNVPLWDGTSGKLLKNSNIDGDWFNQDVKTTGTPTFSTVTADQIAANQTVTANSVVIPTVFNDQIEPTGFYDRTATLSFDDGTRTFTITGAHTVYRSGVKRTLTTASLVISNVQGNHYIYYNSSWQLAETTTLTTFAEPYVAVVYWNTSTSKGLLADERHGIVMDASTQDYLHNSVGTRYISGFAASFSDASFTMGSGVIMDEDLRHTIAETTSCLVLYKNGSASYEWDVSTDVYYKLVSGSLQYNNGNTLTPVDANKYCAAWIFATNIPSYPIFALIGQRQDTLLVDARANNDYNSLGLADLPFREFKILYRVILRNDGTPYVETSDMRTVSQFGTSATVISAHNALTGLDYATAGHTGFLASTAIDDTAYGASWDGDTTHAPTKNAIYDKIEGMGGASVSDEAYGATWDGVTDVAPSKNAVYDAISGLPATHAAVTINATANGLSIVGQELALALSSTSTTGALSATDWDTFNGKQDALTFGIADTNAVRIDSASVADDEYARFTANGLESRSTSEVLSDIGALSTGHLTDFTHSDIAHTNRSDLDLVSGTNTGDQDLSGYALKSNVLELDNTTPFTPDADYEPATKKYVDDNAGGGGASVSDEAYGSSWNGVTTVAPSKNAVYDEIQGHDDVEVILDKVINGGDGEIAGQLNAILNGGAMPALAHPHALVEEVLTFTNTTAFTPDSDYEPATKKYVDDEVGAKQDTLTFGIADNNTVTVDDALVEVGDYAKFTATGLEGRSASEVLSDIGAAASSHAHDSLTNSNTGDPVVKLWTGTQSEYDAIGTGNYDATTLYTITDASATFETMVDNTDYGAGWDGDTTHAPSKNAVYDKIETLSTGGAPVTIWGYM